MRFPANYCYVYGRQRRPDGYERNRRIMMPFGTRTYSVEECTGRAALGGWLSR
jgi:hypothetical protein